MSICKLILGEPQVGSQVPVQGQEETRKSFKGKAIYRPNGKAAEYSEWACNFYNGCTHNCSYCYNNHNLMSKTVGGTDVRLKKSLVDEQTAFQIFMAELTKVKDSIIKEDKALHFNFVSDPCLPETIELNWKCIGHALREGVKCQILTKAADWLENPVVVPAFQYKELISVGFTLTGCDDQEPGAAPNAKRIEAMKQLHDMGIKTWASIEPIIDPVRSFEMIKATVGICNYYKIGILSGKKSYNPDDIRTLKAEVDALNLEAEIYWKHSLTEFINNAMNADYITKVLTNTQPRSKYDTDDSHKGVLQ